MNISRILHKQSYRQHNSYIVNIITVSVNNEYRLNIIIVSVNNEYRLKMHPPDAFTECERDSPKMKLRIGKSKI